MAIQGDTLFVWGMAGAALAEFVALRALRESDKPKWNRERKAPGFWILCLLALPAGGVVALAHEGGDAALTPWLAINVGFTWPLLIRRGASATPETPYPNVD